MKESIENEEQTDEPSTEEEGETSLSAAHGILSEIDQRVHCLKEGVIRLDERQLLWIHGKLAELRAAL